MWRQSLCVLVTVLVMEVLLIQAVAEANTSQLPQCTRLTIPTRTLSCAQRCGNVAPAPGRSKQNAPPATRTQNGKDGKTSDEHSVYKTEHSERTSYPLQKRTRQRQNIQNNTRVFSKRNTNFVTGKSGETPIIRNSAEKELVLYQKFGNISDIPNHTTEILERNAILPKQTKDGNNVFSQTSGRYLRKANSSPPQTEKGNVSSYLLSIKTNTGPPVQQDGKKSNVIADHTTGFSNRNANSIRQHIRYEMTEYSDYLLRNGSIPNRTANPLHQTVSRRRTALSERRITRYKNCSFSQNFTSCHTTKTTPDFYATRTSKYPVPTPYVTMTPNPLPTKLLQTTPLAHPVPTRLPFFRGMSRPTLTRASSSSTTRLPEVRHTHSRMTVLRTSSQLPVDQSSPRTATSDQSGLSARLLNLIGQEGVTSFQCHCDVMCPLYGDCCADYYQLCLGVNITERMPQREALTSSGISARIDEKLMPLFSHMGCEQLSLASGYYRVINRCDDHFGIRQAANRRQCEGRTFHENITSAPYALLRDRRIVFKNPFCAFCNGIPVVELDRENPVVFPECRNTRIVSQYDLRQALARGHCWRAVNATIVSLLRRCPRPSLVQPTCRMTSDELGQSHGERRYQKGNRFRERNHINQDDHCSDSVGASPRNLYDLLRGRSRNVSQGHGQSVSQEKSVRGSCIQHEQLINKKMNFHGTDTLHIRGKEQGSVFGNPESLVKGNSADKPNCSSTYNTSQIQATTLLEKVLGRRDFQEIDKITCETSNEEANKKKRKPRERLSSSKVLCHAYKYYVYVASESWEQIFANPDCLACSLGITQPQLLQVGSVCGTTPAAQNVGNLSLPGFSQELVTPSFSNKATPMPENTKLTTLLIHRSATTAAPPGFFGAALTSHSQEFTSAVPPPFFAHANSDNSGSGLSSFRVYFQLSQDSWDYRVQGHVISPQIITCPDDEVYVPYYSSCETMYCPQFTYPFRGRCLMREPLVADSALQPFPNGTTRYSLHVTLLVPVLTNQTEPSDAVLDLKKAYESFLQLESSFSGTGISDISEANISVVSVQKMKPKALNESQSSIVLSSKMDIAVHNSSLHHVVVLSESLVNGTVNFTGSYDVQVQSIVVSSDLPEDLECPNGTIKHPRNQTLEIDDAHAYYLRTMTTFYNLENIGFELQTFPTDNSTPVLLHTAVCGPTSVIHCHRSGYIRLNASDFTATNESLNIQSSGDTFSESQFVVFENGSAIVCSIYNATYTANIYTFVMMRDYLLEGALSITALSLSMVSLVVVLVTYSLLPQLRNVPGVIVMSYSGSLLSIQALSFLSGFPRGWLCELHACLSHATLLSTFLWKSALSFDLVFMLRMKAIENSSHATRVLMLNCYSVVGWLLPAVSVLIFWLLDHFEVYVLRYGAKVEGVCWLANAEPNFYLVMLPLIITWVFNVVCFSLALRLIYQSGRLHGTAARSRNRRASERRRLMAYARISLLMGCTWLVSFVAAALNLNELWLAHFVLNGSQGFYLLICFVLKRRVWDMLKQQLGSKGGPRAQTTSETTTSTTATSVSIVASGQLLGRQ